MIVKHVQSDSSMVAVTFQVPGDIWADRINLVGDFNGWDSGSHPLTPTRDGQLWQITLMLERGRSYLYRYLVDGAEWRTDQTADGLVPGPQEGWSSVIQT